MKTTHYLALLKNDLRVVWFCLPLGAFYAYLELKEFRPDQMFGLQSISGGGGFLVMIPFFMWNLLFENQNYGLKQGSRALVASLEFMFTRAINRASLFSAKTALYLLISSMPLAFTWAYSFATPVIKIELPYNTLHHREETKQFFLSHFEGAYLQEPDNGGNKDYVVLPHGRTDQATCVFLCNFIFTLMFQAILFFFKKQRGIALIALFLSFILTAFAGFSRTTPSLYEVSVAWVSQHNLLAFVGVGLLTVLAQLYCCRRFVNTEITS